MLTQHDVNALQVHRINGPSIKVHLLHNDASDNFIFRRYFFLEQHNLYLFMWHSISESLVGQILSAKHIRTKLSLIQQKKKEAI